MGLSMVLSAGSTRGHGGSQAFLAEQPPLQALTTRRGLDAQVLDLTGAVQVSDDGARALAGCTELRETVLTWCACHLPRSASALLLCHTAASRVFVPHSGLPSLLVSPTSLCEAVSRVHNYGRIHVVVQVHPADR